MDSEQLSELVFNLLDHNILAGEAREFVPRRAWALRREDTLSFVGVLDNPSHIRVTTGMATDVALTGDVALFLSALNRDLWTGRAYLWGNQETGLGSALMQDIHFGEALSLDFPESLQAATSAINTLTLHATIAAPQLIQRFGGRPLREDELPLLLD